MARDGKCIYVECSSGEQFPLGTALCNVRSGIAKWSARADFNPDDDNAQKMEAWYRSEETKLLALQRKAEVERTRLVVSDFKEMPRYMHQWRTSRTVMVRAIRGIKK